MTDQSRPTQQDWDLGNGCFELIGNIVGQAEQLAQRLAVPVPFIKALHTLDCPMAMKELGKRMHCDPSFVTLVTDMLEKRGLARREPHLVDRLLRVLRSRLGHAILMEVERAKIDLTSSDLAACDLTAIEDGLSVSISNADLGAAIGSEMRSIFAGIAETVRLAGLRFDQIGKVFTTGARRRCR